MSDARLAQLLMQGSGLDRFQTPWMERPEYKPPANPYKSPWDYPEWTARHGELRAPAERPKDWSAPIAEAISPTMGGYGLGSGAATAYRHGQEGDWRAAGGEAAMLAAGAIMPGPKAAPKQGIRAYHGSPHDFDKFDMSKIGTGEGAQAYGHGLYFAEAEAVAKEYRDRLSSGFTGSVDDARSAAARAMEYHGGNKAKAIADLEENAKNYQPRAALLREAQRMIDADEYRPGRMYEVRINADPADFLDWDKPLSQQSEKVRGAMNRLANGEILPDDTGEQALRSVAMQMGSSKFLENPELGRRLSDAGVVGAKYLDQGSRSEGAGTHNYVLFRDDIIDIVKKYGIAAAASMYGMDAVQNVMLGEKLQEPAQ